MRVLSVDGRIVLPYSRGPAPYRFATLGDHEDLGRVAVVTESAATPMSMATIEAATTPEHVDDVATFILGELAWLQGIPVGSKVYLSDKGRMRARVSAEHLDWHRHDVRAWTKQQRRDGYLPVLATNGDRVRVVALPWRGPLAAVDLADVRARLPQYGLRHVDHVEIL